LSVDGVIQPLPPENFQLPAALDKEQQVSVVFAMDYSGSTRAFQGTMEDAVLAFIDRWQSATTLLSSNSTIPNRRVNGYCPHLLEKIDGGSGTSMLESGVRRPFSGSGSPVIDAINEALKLFASTPNTTGGPAGDHPRQRRRRQLLGQHWLSGGHGSQQARRCSLRDRVGDTSQNVRNRDITGAELMQELAGQTGGLYGEATDSTSIEELYLQVSNLLANEYLLVFPFDVEECQTYGIEVSGEEFMIFLRN
jgi:hypothetical protein